MSNDNTNSKKLSITERLDLLEAIARDLESYGVHINNAEVSVSLGDSILVYAHDEPLAAFQTWMKRERLEPTFYELQSETGNDWGVETDCAGVTVHGYLTDKEKEAWENDIYPRDPA